MAARQHLQHYAPSPSDQPQRRCSRGLWCSAKTRDAETGEWHAALATQPLCPADQAIMIQCLGELPVMYARLGEQLGDPVRRTAPVRVPPGSRVLVNPDVEALMRLMSDQLGGWAVRVRAIPQLSLAIPGAPHGTPGRVAADCATLAAHPGPLLALGPRLMPRTWTWPAGSPMPAWLEDEIGGLEVLHAGDGWAEALTRLDGEDAALDVLDLHRLAVRLLQENPAPPEWLDGIPCRECGKYALACAPLPAGPEVPGQPSPAFSRCHQCRHEMSREDYDEWVRLNDAHARHTAGITCRRCQRDDCAECAWAACACTARDHPRRRAAA